MHPLTHGNLAAAALDAKRLARALSRQDIVLAVALLRGLMKKLESAVEIEALLERRKNGTG